MKTVSDADKPTRLKKIPVSWQTMRQFIQHHKYTLTHTHTNYPAFFINILRHK